MSLWPQYTYLLLTALGLGLNMGKHGDPRPNYNFWTSLFAGALGMWILYEGGFFDQML